VHRDYAGRALYYLRYDIDDIYLRLLAERHPNAPVKRYVGEGDVVQLANFSELGSDAWAGVDVLQFQQRTPTPGDPRPIVRDYARGFLRLPLTAPESVLASVPDHLYYDTIVPGGLPSHLAVGDTVILREDYPGPGEGVHTVVPTHEHAPPDMGVLSMNDVAYVESGPIRTPQNLLYWKVTNLNGSQAGYVREFTRAGSRLRFLLRPHRIGRR